MANRYEFALAFKYGTTQEQAIAIIRERTKRLQDLRIIEAGRFLDNAPTLVCVRFRVTCSWRTMEKIWDFLFNHPKRSRYMWGVTEFRRHRARWVEHC